MKSIIKSTLLSTKMPLTTEKILVINTTHIPNICFKLGGLVTPLKI
jgi:hypothetical protein